MRPKYLTVNSSQTKKLGEILAKEILKTPPREKAFVVGLEGDLGGGKTTFLQGFARGLGTKQRITSPTFVILRKYKISRFHRGFSTKSEQDTKHKIQNFYHIDCYRLKKPKEILDLGLKKIISSPQNILAIEWAERIRKILPKDSLTVKFEFVGPVRDSEDKEKRQRRQISRGVDKNKRKIILSHGREKAINNH